MAREQSPPKGLLLLLLRFPILLFRLGLGGLMTKHFLLLKHIGRKTGLTRYAVLEIVRREEATGTIIIVSGMGTQSQWYKNLLHQPNVSIQLGRRTYPVRAEPLPKEACGEEMVRYARRHPRAAKFLSKQMGFDADGSEEGYRRIGEQLQFFALVPREEEKSPSPQPTA